jgi:hypothetical protein
VIARVTRPSGVPMYPSEPTDPLTVRLEVRLPSEISDARLDARLSRHLRRNEERPLLVNNVPSVYVID